MSKHATAGGPPNGGWGWVVVITCFFNLLILTSCFTTFTYLYVDLLEIYHERQSLIAAIGAIQTGVVFAVNIPAGTLVHHFGCRPIAILGGFIMSVGVATSAFAQDVNTLCITYGLVGGIGGGLALLPSFVVVQQYFSTMRALAAGITVCGLSVSGIAGPPLFRLATDHFGWRGALVLHGGVMLHSILFAATFRPLPYIEELKRQEKLTELQKKRPKSCWTIFNSIIRVSLFKDVDFTLWCIGNFFMNIGIMPFYQHLVNLNDYKGFTPENATFLLIALGSASLASRIMFSIIANLKNVDRLLLYTSGSIISGILLCFTFFVDAFVPALVWTSCMGFAFGSVVTIQATVLVDLMGIQRFPQAQGLFSLFGGTSTIIASPFTGYMVDSFKNYDLPFLINGAVQLFGCCILLIVVFRRCCRSRREKKLIAERNKLNGAAVEHIEMWLTSL